MYEQMKNEFKMHLVYNCNLDTETLQSVLSCLDCAVYNYEVSAKETQIVPYNQELHPVAQMFIVSKSIEGYAEGTLYNYTSTLRNFLFTVQKSPEQVITNDIRLYLYKYQKERGVSNRSLDKIRNCICVFYKWMLAEGYIDKNPTLGISPIKYEKKPKTPCTQVDLEYLRRACQTPKQRAILEVLYSTGCRVGELVALKKSDINWNDKSVHLFGKGKKHRTSFLNAKAEVALLEYLSSRDDDNEWVFVSDRSPHNQMHTDGIQKIIRLMSERAGENVNKNVTPHILRHTMATRMIENESDITAIQQILGHANINTTMTYIHTSLEHAQTEHLKAVV